MVALSRPIALVILSVTATMAQFPEPFFPTPASVDFAEPAVTQWTPIFPTLAPANTATASSPATTQCQNDEYLCICRYYEAVKYYNDKCQLTLLGCGHKPRKEDYCSGKWLLANGGDRNQKTASLAYLYFFAAAALLVLGYGS